MMRCLLNGCLFSICTISLVGCHNTSSSADPAASQAERRWHATGDYYALLELVDTHIDPEWNGKVSKADVVKYLGEGIHDPAVYPNAGPTLWVYPSRRPAPSGSYLFIEFNENGLVKRVYWGSE